MGADEICAMSLGPPIRPAKPEGPEWVVVALVGVPLLYMLTGAE